MYKLKFTKYKKRHIVGNGRHVVKNKLYKKVSRDNPLKYLRIFTAHIARSFYKFYLLPISSDFISTLCINRNHRYCIRLPNNYRSRCNCLGIRRSNCYCNRFRIRRILGICCSCCIGIYPSTSTGTDYNCCSCYNRRNCCCSHRNRTGLRSSSRVFGCSSYRSCCSRTTESICCSNLVCIRCILNHRTRYWLTDRCKSCNYWRNRCRSCCSHCRSRCSRHNRYHNRRSHLQIESNRVHSLDSVKPCCQTRGLIHKDIEDSFGDFIIFYRWNSEFPNTIYEF